MAVTYGPPYLEFQGDNQATFGNAFTAQFIPSFFGLMTFGFVCDIGMIWTVSDNIQQLTWTQMDY